MFLDIWFLLTLAFVSALEVFSTSLSGLTNSTRPTESVTFWAAWQSWSECSETCGIGERTRKRICIHRQGVYVPTSFCDGANEEASVCQLQRCPKPKELKVIFKDRRTFPDVIRLMPSSEKGETRLTVYCYAPGLPVSHVKWMRDGEVIKSGNGRVVQHGVRKPASSRRLKIRPFLEEDYGEYTCVAYDGGAKNVMLRKSFTIVSVVPTTGIPVTKGPTGILTPSTRSTPLLHTPNYVTTEQPINRHNHSFAGKAGGDMSSNPLILSLPQHPTPSIQTDSHVKPFTSRQTSRQQTNTPDPTLHTSSSIVHTTEPQASTEATTQAIDTLVTSATLTSSTGRQQRVTSMSVNSHRRYTSSIEDLDVTTEALSTETVTTSRMEKQQTTTQRATTRAATTQAAMTQAAMTQAATTQTPTTQTQTTQAPTTPTPTTQTPTTRTPTTQAATTQASTTKQEATTRKPTSRKRASTPTVTRTPPPTQLTLNKFVAMRTDQLSVTTSHAGVDTSVSHTSTPSTSHQHENEIHFVSETNLDDVATDPIMSTTYSSTSRIPVLRDNTLPTIADVRNNELEVQAGISSDNKLLIIVGAASVGAFVVLTSLVVSCLVCSKRRKKYSPNRRGSGHVRSSSFATCDKERYNSFESAMKFSPSMASSMTHLSRHLDDSGLTVYGEMGVRRKSSFMVSDIVPPDMAIQQRKASLSDAIHALDPMWGNSERQLPLSAVNEDSTHASGVDQVDASRRSETPLNVIANGDVPHSIGLLHSSLPDNLVTDSDSTGVERALTDPVVRPNCEVAPKLDTSDEPTATTTAPTPVGSAINLEQQKAEHSVIMLSGEVNQLATDDASSQHLEYSLSDISITDSEQNEDDNNSVAMPEDLVADC